MKSTLLILSFFVTVYSYTQSVEEAQILFEKQDYKTALDVIKKCKKTEETEILKAKINYFLGYGSFACENLKLINSEKSLLVYDSLCNINLDILTLPKDKNENYYFEEVVTINEDIPAQDLFILVKEWFVYTFGSLNTSIKFIDENNYKIICPSKINYDAAVSKPGKLYSGFFRFILTFECRDNRFKYKIDKIEHIALKEKFSIGLNFNYDPSDSRKITPYSQKKVIQDFQKQFDVLIESIRNIKPIEKEEDNW